MKRVRTFICCFAIALCAIAMTNRGLAQAKSTSNQAIVPKTEKELKTLLQKGKKYKTKLFTIDGFEYDQYIVMTYDETQDQGETAVKQFFGGLSIAMKRVEINTITDMGGERPMVEPIAFLQKLPRETAHYRIEFVDSSLGQWVFVQAKCVVDHRAITQEISAKWPTYKKYTEEALQWLKAQKFNREWFELRVYGESCWPKGKSIKY